VKCTGNVRLNSKMSNGSWGFYATTGFTDQEVATLYIFGVVSGLTNVRAIYDYAHRHLREGCPALGTYQAFSYRLNRISASFSLLCEHLW
jgi:hypothetical protein